MKKRIVNDFYKTVTVCDSCGEQDDNDDLVRDRDVLGLRLELHSRCADMTRRKVRVILGLRQE